MFVSVKSYQNPHINTEKINQKFKMVIYNKWRQLAVV